MFGSSDLKAFLLNKVEIRLRSPAPEVNRNQSPKIDDNQTNRPENQSKPEVITHHSPKPEVQRQDSSKTVNDVAQPDIEAGDTENTQTSPRARDIARADSPQEVEQVVTDDEF